MKDHLSHQITDRLTTRPRLEVSSSADNDGIIRDFQRAEVASTSNYLKSFLMSDKNTGR
jgi:hypothetical protein